MLHAFAINRIGEYGNTFVNGGIEARDFADFRSTLPTLSFLDFEDIAEAPVEDFDDESMVFYCLLSWLEFYMINQYISQSSKVISDTTISEHK